MEFFFCEILGRREQGSSCHVDMLVDLRLGSVDAVSLCFVKFFVQKSQREVVGVYEFSPCSPHPLAPGRLVFFFLFCRR